MNENDLRALLGRSPHNVALIESCPGDGDARFSSAAETLGRWQSEGVLRRDESPRYYAYEQRFTTGGATLTRRAFFARLGIEAEGIDAQGTDAVRPHEQTMAGPRAERLALLRATATNVSPIFCLFEDPGGSAASVLAEAATAAPHFKATDGAGVDHRLWPLTAPEQIETLTEAVAHSAVTIADGHHRYFAAVDYLREQQTPEAAWTLAGLVPTQDPGLVILPAHRLVRADRLPSDLLERLSELFVVEDITPRSWDGAAVHRLWGRVRANARGPVTFGAIGLEEQRLHVLTARSSDALRDALPSSWSPASRSLDVLVLTETVLGPLLGIDQQALTRGDRVGFTSDVEEAWRMTDSGRYRLAFLVNPTRAEQVMAVAGAGEVMPQKSTYFYPKMGTGLVLNPVD